VFDKLLSLGLDYFSRQHSSRLITRVSHNVGACSSVVMTVSTSLGRDVLTLIGLTAVMVYQDPVMSLLALSIGPPLVLGMIGIVKRIRDLSKAELGAHATVNANTQEAMQGIRIVKSFTLEQQMRERVGEAVDQVEERANTVNRLVSSRTPLMEALGGISIGLVTIYAGLQTIAFGKTPGEYMAFITAFLLAYAPAKRLAGLNVSLQRQLIGVRMMYELLDLPEGQPELPDAVALSRAQGRIALADVTFGYAEARPVLKSVSIEAEPGKVVALVGPSGAGKTTIVNLIQRFYDPWSGRVTIDGFDVRKATLASLRRQISFVSQDTFLFSGSIRENIAMGRADATAREVEAAAEAANAIGFISELEDGFDTLVGENGALFSGGQRQRIAIARAILKDAPILLLDEATSALDTESERQVQIAIQRLMKGRTTIVIAHRLSTIARADRTYVIEAGSVVESGSHSSLLARDRLYARLFGPVAPEPAQLEAEDLATHWEISG
jgi:ATP-binding cassette subfamily B protein